MTIETNSDKKQKENKEINPEVLHYIDNEIEHIRNEIQQPGWTIWAILGALATVIWLFIGELEKQLYILNNVLLLSLLIFYLGNNLLGSILRVLFWAQKPNLLLSASQAKMHRNIFRELLAVMVSLCAILITYHFSNDFDPTFIKLSYIWNSFFIFGLFMRLLLQPIYEKVDYVEKVNPPTRFSVRALILLIPFITYLSWQIIDYIIDKQIIITFDDIKVVGLIVAFYILLRVFVGIRTSSPTLSTLVEIRRKYFLGQISNETINDQIEAALIGLNISDYLQKRLSTFLFLVQEGNFELDQADIKLNLLNQKYEETEKPTLELQVTIDALNEALFQHCKRYEKHLHSMVFREYLLLVGQKLNYRLILDMESSLDKTRKKMSDTIVNSRIHYETLVTNWLKLLSVHETEETVKVWKEKTKGQLTLTRTFPPYFKKYLPQEENS